MKISCLPVLGLLAAIAAAPALAQMAGPRSSSTAGQRGAAPPMFSYSGERTLRHLPAPPPVPIRFVPVVRVYRAYPQPMSWPVGSYAAPPPAASAWAGTGELINFTDRELQQAWGWSRVDSVAALVPH